ncbi:unnamed protein product [Parnassius apollo]|uniref:(apollo) hypothetical protein n=1 Tax=Parnassius apollo TaxID=110799 RepID=A0A8S3XEY3_PARAO|nr:unnamed protein product [Parnassius apollo]
MNKSNITIEESTEGSSSSDESKYSDGSIPLSTVVEVNTLPVLASTATTPDSPSEGETVEPTGAYKFEINFPESTSVTNETDQNYEKSTNTEAISEDEIHECYDFEFSYSASVKHEDYESFNSEFKSQRDTELSCDIEFITYAVTFIRQFSNENGPVLPGRLPGHQFKSKVKQKSKTDLFATCQKNVTTLGRMSGLNESEKVETAP